MHRGSSRQACVFFMSCLGHPIKHFLQLSDDFNKRYVLYPFIFHNVTQLGDLWPRMQPHIEDCSLLIYHEAQWLPTPLYDEAIERIESAVPDGTTIISLPVPYMHAFWPFYCQETRNADHTRPPNRYGQLPTYHYGDSYVLGLLKQGIDAEEIISRYLALDVGSQVDLDALLRHTLSLIERNERGAAVRIADYIGSNFRRENLFRTINHPNNRLLHYVSNQILKYVKCREVPVASLLTLGEIIGEPMPIHPSIGRYYGAKYINEDTRYSIDEVRNLTFSEFIRDYVYYKDGLINEWGTLSLGRRGSRQATGMKVPARIIPTISQAEAYHDGNLVLIRNNKTENVVEFTKRHLTGGEVIREVPDFPSFLDTTAEAIIGARIIVALGDSRTANFSNWPRVLATTHLEGRNAVVLNLADWASCSEDHVSAIEPLLSWLHEHGAKQIYVVLFGELNDLHRKLSTYAEYFASRRPQPFSSNEEQLATHRHGDELSQLLDQIPGDLIEAEIWIARRVVAVTRLMHKICADANAKFLAVLEPIAFPDNCPGYLPALRRTYEESAPSGLDFEPWILQHSYARDPSEHFKQDIRPLFEKLRDLWRSKERHPDHGNYADLSDLFLKFDGCCFSPIFDALHYNGSGVSLIANALFELLLNDH